jgi:hypothetical protein
MLLISILFPAVAMCDSWTDLNVTYIERVPHTRSLHGMLDYRVRHLPWLTEEGREQTKKLEPDEGEEVKFLCRIVNRSDRELQSVGAVALIDGRLVTSGSKKTLAPGETWVFEVPWQWRNGEHTIECRVDLQDNIKEDCESNNSLVDRIDGLGFRFFVTQRCYDSFNSRLNMVGSKSFEDYLQYHLSEMNRTFKEAVYPFTPNGCSERVRFDQLYVCEDNDALRALQKELGKSDHQGGWSFDVWDQQAIRATTLDSGLCHELMHQLGVIDLYTLNCSPSGNTLPGPDGEPIGVGFYWDDQECVMIRCGGWYKNFDVYRFRNGRLVPMEMWGPPLNKVSAHTAAALEIQKGRPRGYFGDYLWPMPETTHIRVLDSAGMPVEGAEVKCFQTLRAGHAHRKASLGTEPKTEGKTDADGRITLKNYPVPEVEPSFQGFTMEPNPFGRVNNHGQESTMFVTISAKGQTEYRWLPITALNLACYIGNEKEYTVTYRTKVPPKGTRVSAPKARLDDTALEWTDVRGAASYRVYGLNRVATENDASWYSLVTETSRTVYDLPVSDHPHYAFVVTSIDEEGNESAFSEAVKMPPSWELRQAYGFGVGPPEAWNLKRYVFPQKLEWLQSQVEFDLPNQEISEPRFAVRFRVHPGYYARFTVGEDGSADGGIYGGAKFSDMAIQFLEREIAVDAFDKERREKRQ